MSNHKIEPHRITKPIQLMAVWFITLVILVGTFSTAAVKITSPTWISPFLIVSSVVITLVFVVLSFLMQTKFRTHLQEDRYYAGWLKRQKTVFKDFRAENIDVINNVTRNITTADKSWENQESRRIERYQIQRGLFIVHTWRASDIPGQVADIVIWLHQHGSGPLSENKVERVEYCLASKFNPYNIIKLNATDNFKLHISAYGSFLCLAKAYVNGEKAPIELERYINIELA